MKHLGSSILVLTPLLAATTLGAAQTVPKTSTNPVAFPNARPQVTTANASKEIRNNRSTSTVDTTDTSTPSDFVLVADGP